MNPAKILVVEDEQYLRDLYTDILTEEGYSVESAEDGNQGLEKIKKGGWDLVLLDIILPGVDGIEIMKQVKRYPPSVPNKKVIYLTNLDKDKEMEQAMALGDGYIIKSQITPDVLLGKIKTFLNPGMGTTPQAVPESPQIPPKGSEETSQTLPEEHTAD